MVRKLKALEPHTKTAPAALVEKITEPLEVNLIAMAIAASIGLSTKRSAQLPEISTNLFTA